MIYKVSTTGTHDPVILEDLGQRTLNHPTVDIDLGLEYTDDELMDSGDLQDAVGNGWIVVTEEVGASATEEYVDDEISTASGVLQGQVDAKPDTFLELTDTPSTYNTGKYLRSTVVGTEWVDSDAFSSVSPENIIYIAKNGNDVTASGTFNDPFLTIKHAISTVSGCCDEVNRHVFKVSSGIFYEDNPLQMEVYTQIVGEGGFFSTCLLYTSPSPRD